MRNKVYRIALDTNLWISFLLTKNYAVLDELLFEKECVLIFSQELLDEFLEVCRRPKLRKYFKQEDLEELLETINEYAIFIKVNTSVSACRDPKDNFLLSLAIDGGAHFLLTGDKDLLALKKFGQTEIITITTFQKEIK